MNLFEPSILCRLGAALLLAAAPAAGWAETEARDPAAAPAAEERDENSEAMPSFFAMTTVTATGTETDAFDVPTPVTVIDARKIEERMPENAADLLRFEPGVDVNGVGPNQTRPVIRGQRGLRVLFLENGLRMNNARRQTDFGEIPGLVDLDSVSAVEVVRGPASVLYGSDAIGGVLNLVTRIPSPAGGRRYGGSAALRYGEAGDLTRASVSVEGRQRSFAFSLGAATRSAEDYESASGRFGNIDLPSGATVVDSGVDDDSVFGFAGFDLSDSQEIFLRLNRYRAGRTGFGFVEPELLGESEDFRIRILYPFQDFDRWTAGYLGTGYGLGWIDSLEAQAYLQTNERQLVNDIDINIGPIFPGAPDSSVAADTRNFTDLETLGLRFEAVKVVGERHLVTYGAELYEDDSFNTDFSVTTATLRFPGPPFEVESAETDAVANAPNATNSSSGVFAQAELAIGDRFKTGFGARYQTVSTRAEATPGWDVAGLDFDDENLVGSLGFVYRATDYLHLVGSVGTAFRAPNIVERLFNGPTPEGAGFQLLNPDLVSETSENVDLGLKYRRQRALFELTLFRNDVDEGVIQDFLTPAEIAALPPDVRQRVLDSGARFVVRQTNADRLRYEGLEARADWASARGWTLGASYTHLDGKRLDSTNPPTGDTVTDKVTAYVRFQPGAGRYWLEYRGRYNGDEPANLDPGEPVPPVGEILPSFTVHHLAGGVNLPERGRFRHELSARLENVTDELYAEFSNSTFFRPQAGRAFLASYRLRY